jgi:hypothetical protein
MQGNTDWASSAGTNADNSEWIVMDQNFIDSLGTHYLVIPEPSDDASIIDLLVDGVTVQGFSPAQLSYFITLAAGRTEIPVVTATPSDEMATVDVTPVTNLTGTEAERTATVLITAEDGTTTKTYTIVFNLEVGIENSIFDNVKVYPVPAVNKLHIDNIGSAQNLTVFDITGAAVMNIKTGGQNSVTLDISSMNSGVYMLRMTGEEATGVVRFIKE